MKWRAAREGDRWHRIDVYRARKNRIRYVVAPCYGDRWYVVADLPDGNGVNSLWTNPPFATADAAMAWCETWHPALAKT